MEEERFTQVHNLFFTFEEVRWKEAFIVGRQHEMDDLKRILLNSHSHIAVIGLPEMGKSLVVAKLIENNLENYDTITYIDLTTEMSFTKFLDSFKQTILSNENTSMMNKDVLMQSILSKLGEFHSNLIVLENYEIILPDI